MNLQLTLDRAAIGLSLLCAVHCFLLPVAIVLLSTSIPFTLDDEAFHRWLLIGILPISVVALTMGCRKHKRYRVYLLGALGLLVLGLAGYLGHDYLGEVGEKVFTLIGGIIIAAGHIFNYQLCQKQGCDCSSHSTEKTPHEWTLS